MYEEIIDDLQRRLSSKRFAHTLGVARAAVALADRYGEDPEEAYLAGLLHDCAKEIPLSQMQELVDNSSLTIDVDMYVNGALLHGVSGAILANARYGVRSSYILDAIRYHTTGRVGMTTLDKIIFLADYIEETRDFPGVEVLRKIAFEDLDQGVLAGYDNTIHHLLDQGLSIYYKTILGRNDIIRRIKSR
ncbi:bis(5'-nucleosyl)-tetraphosphatase (symmetrical) YqeK [Veillonella criceti]|uniref:bis(5'-nucleosyl)-tetraphosphatase (symmetrical) n=1 Tax=Veillonella criceti TaxID=103891 RepID=A0A380NII8_9FIRM|nr:bis(5'-nucleosyl)-tetraphosphatase (symmetrical) YqeK [Veillonella criceti]SUP40576.1 putative nicotinate-nucleotide adenylyltransferase [Veillonella criceti]